MPRKKSENCKGCHDEPSNITLNKVLLLLSRETYKKDKLKSVPSLKIIMTIRGMVCEGLYRQEAFASIKPDDLIEQHYHWLQNREDKQLVI